MTTNEQSFSDTLHKMGTVASALGHGAFIIFLIIIVFFAIAFVWKSNA